MSETCDLAVIGAGPAGMAAATIAARLGVETVVLDEQPSPGGQIYRAITETPVRRGTIFGDDYWRGLDLVRAFDGSGATYRPGSAVFSVDARAQDGRHEIGASRDGTAQLLHARHVIVATGAQERPMPIPGWTLPGVLTAGAAQILLKGAGLAPSGRTVLAGSGPLLWLLAAQMLRAGGSLAAILDTTPRMTFGLDMLSFLASPYLSKGWALMRETRRYVTPLERVTDLRAEGDSRLRRVSYTDRSGAAGGSIAIRCCCTKAWCPTSTSRCRSAARIAGRRAALLRAGARRLGPQRRAGRVDRRRRRGHRRRRGGG